jgi:SAM-dependent methyltransferase
VAESLLRDYSRQARTYDSTRSASPAVVAALRSAIDPAPGRRLADIGGGTGNYALALAEHGWSPMVIDRQPEMLARAADKGLATLQAPAERLPLADATFDAALMISMLHHVEDQGSALEEAKRILRPGGRLAIKMYTREDVEGLWLNGYFPSTRPWMDATHPPRAEFAQRLPGAELQPLRMGDLSDASLAALAAHPEKILERDWRTQTSYFERLERDHPDELARGLARLAAEIECDQGPRAEAGTATLISWKKPTGGAPYAPYAGETRTAKNSERP